MLDYINVSPAQSIESIEINVSIFVLSCARVCFSLHIAILMCIGFIYIYTYIYTLALGLYGNCTSCAQVHEMPQSHYRDNKEEHCFHDSKYNTHLAKKCDSQTTPSLERK